MATLVREEGRSGIAGAEEEMEGGVAVAVVDVGAAADLITSDGARTRDCAPEVTPPPAPALSQGFGGDDEDIVIVRSRCAALIAS